MTENVANHKEQPSPEAVIRLIFTRCDNESRRKRLERSLLLPLFGGPSTAATSLFYHLCSRKNNRLEFLKRDKHG